ncbi:MAG: hypothetical protein Ct9H300mP25_00210 [Acidobacteriota bacterium]|nr:MAG: hypothetical protein Ct9H300mP25_00210 [Acidobacteriota bacterium]
MARSSCPKLLVTAPLASGLVYIGLLTLASSLLGLPFRLYSTFVIKGSLRI